MSTLQNLKDVSLLHRRQRSLIAGAIAAVLSNATQIAKEASTDKSTFSVTDAHAITAVQKALKQANETLTILASKGDDSSDVYTNTRNEVEVLKALLPAVPSAEDVENYVTQYIAHHNVPKAMTSMGAVMKATKDHFGPTLDGSQASVIIKRLLV